MVATAASFVPMFLVGTLAVYLQADLGIDDVGLGLLVAVGAMSGALFSTLGGRMVERIGVGRALRLGVLLSAVNMVGIATVAQSWAVAAALMVFAGVGPTLSQPATILWLSREIPAERQGIVFGINQCAGPASTLVAGLSVPLIAGTLGWRWAYGLIGAVTVVLAFCVPQNRRRPRPARRFSRDGDMPLPPLIVLMLALLLSLFTITAFSAFAMSSMASAGVPEGVGGVVIAGGSIAAMITRLSAGQLADRRTGGSHLRTSAVMVATGSLGFILLSTGSAWAMVGGVIVVFSMSWGWQGLFTLALTRINPNAPAAAMGIVFTGGNIGSVIGPAAFGIVAGVHLASAWWMAAGMALLNAVLLLVARRMVMRRLAPTAR